MRCARACLGEGVRENEEMETHASSPDLNDLDYLTGLTLQRHDAEEAARSGGRRHFHVKRNADPELVIEACTRRLDANPNDVRALYIRASSHFKQGRLGLADADLTSFIGAEPEDVSALFLRGRVREKVRTCLAKFVSLDCTLCVVPYGVGATTHMGELDMAIADYSRVLEMDPEHVRAEYQRGACQNMKGDFAGAIQDYVNALEKDQGKSKASAAARCVQQQQQTTTTTPQNGKEDLFRVGVDAGMSTPTAASMRGGRTSSPSPSFMSPQAPHTVMARRAVAHATPSSSSLGTQRRQPERLQQHDEHEHKRPHVSTTAPASSSPMPLATPRGGASSVDSLTSPPSGAGENERVEYYHARGYSRRRAGDFSAAAADYTLALELDPVHFKSLFNRAFALDRLGRYTEALRDYTAAIRVDPSNAYALYNRGITRDRVRDLEGAVADFTAAIRLEAGVADFYHNRGFSMRKLRRFAEAIDDYGKAIGIEPGHCRAYYNRAYCLDQMGRLVEAERDYSAALKLEAGNATAHHNRGSLRQKMGDDAGALEDYAEAIRLHPRGALSYNARAMLLERMRRPDEALEDYSHAIALEPGSAVLHRNRGLCLKGLGEYARCMRDMDEVLRVKETDVQALAARALCCRKMRRYDEAIRDASRAIEQLKSTSSWSSTKRSVGSLDSNIDVGSAGVAGESVYGDEYLCRLHCSRAYCYAKLSRYEDALSDYEAALVINPRDTHARHNAGVSCDRLGWHERAVEEFTAVINLEPSNAAAFFSRGSAYDARGMFDLALSDYTSALALKGSNTTRTPAA